MAGFGFVSPMTYPLFKTVGKVLYLEVKWLPLRFGLLVVVCAVGLCCECPVYVQLYWLPFYCIVTNVSSITGL